MFVHKVRAFGMSVEQLNNGGSIELVSIVSGVEDEAVGIICQDDFQQLLNTSLPCSFFVPLDHRFGEEANLYIKSSHGVDDQTLSAIALPFEVQFALTWHQELTKVTAKTMEVAGLDEGGGELVAVAAPGFVDEHVYGHRSHPGRRGRQKSPRLAAHIRRRKFINET